MQSIAVYKLRKTLKNVKDTLTDSEWNSIDWEKALQEALVYCIPFREYEPGEVFKDDNEFRRSVYSEARPNERYIFNRDSRELDKFFGEGNWQFADGGLEVVLQSIHRLGLGDKDQSDINARVIFDKGKLIVSYNYKSNEYDVTGKEQWEVVRKTLISMLRNAVYRDS